METTTERPSSPMVRYTAKGVKTDTTAVADYFEKRHDNVLRQADHLVAAEPSLHPLHFEEMQTQVATNNGGSRMVRSYELSRDGFMLLAMGFTGPKALRWKMDFIALFNRMEAELRQVGDDELVDELFEQHPTSVDHVVAGVSLSKFNAVVRGSVAAAKLIGPESGRALLQREIPFFRHGRYLVGELAGTNEDDGIGCLSHLARVRVEGGTLLSLMDLAATDTIAAGRLKRHGLWLDPDGVRGSFAVATAHPFLAHAFAETQWVGGWTKALLKIEGARPSPKRRHFGGSVSPSVILPLSVLLTIRGH